jgi:iron complex outermembrane receptor protein
MLSRILLPVFFATQAFAQYSISGRIADPEGQPVSQADVRLYRQDGGWQIATSSASDGRFEFLRVPAGRYWLEARTGGLETHTPLPVAVEGASVQLDVKLALTRVATRVQVTAAALPQSTSDAGKSLDVLDTPELDRRAEFSLTEALRVLPGLRIQQLGGPGSFTRILTRGLRATDTGILVDGMRFRDSGAVQGDAAAFLGDLLLGGSDRIEVLRGSGSSLYGTHSTGGVINLLTATGGGPLRAELSQEGGGLGLYRGLARLSGSALRQRLGYSAALNHLQVASGVDGVERFRNWSGQAAAQWRLQDAHSLGLRVLSTTAMAGVNANPQPAPASLLPAAGFVPARPLAPDQVLLAERGQPFSWGGATFAPNLYDPDSRRNATFSSTLLHYTGTLSPRLTVRGSWQGVASDRDNRNGPAGPGFQQRFNTSSAFGGRIDTAHGRLDWAAAPWSLFSGGYEFERETYRNPSSDENPDPAQRLRARSTGGQRSHSLFFQNQLRLARERLQISLSGRWQGFALLRPSFEGGAPRYEGARLNTPPDAWTGDAAVSYFLARSGTKLRAHAGNAYRAPALYERFGAFFFLGEFGALGDPRLRPERSLGLDAGIDQYLFGSRVRASATVFYTRLQEVIGFGSTPNDPFGRFSGYLNTGGGLARGLELSGEARLGRSTSLQSSYTYTNADERRSSLLGGALASIRVFPHQSTAVLAHQLTRRLSLTADWWWANEYIGGTFFSGTGIRPYLFEGPRKLDAAATYSLPVGERVTLRLFLRAENLLGQRYFEEGFRTPRRWAAAGLRVSF